MQLVPVTGKFIAECKTPRHTDIRRKGGKAPAKFNIKSTRVVRNRYRWELHEQINN